MAIFCRGSNVAEIYRRGTKVLQVYKKGALVYDAGGGEAFGGYIKEGLVLQLDCRRGVDGNEWQSLIKREMWEEEWDDAADDIVRHKVNYYPSFRGTITSIGADGFVGTCKGGFDYKDDCPYYPAHISVCAFVGDGSVRFGYSAHYYLEDDGEIGVPNSVDIIVTSSTITRIRKENDFLWKTSSIEGDFSGLVTISSEKYNEYVGGGKIYVNGVEYTFGDETTTHKDPLSDSIVSADGECKIYSVRVYENSLTDDERDHNRQKDVENFGGQPPVVDRVFADEFSDEFE